MTLRYTRTTDSPTAYIIKQTLLGNHDLRCPPKFFLFDNTQTTVQRVSQQLQLITHRGRTTFVPVELNYLGKSEGQIGGGGAPPRN